MPEGQPREGERHVRGKALVAKVLVAASAELARIGYEKLSFEDVAAAAGVNKTTLYRRWPTKKELIKDALDKISDDVPAPTDQGSLRLDMLSQGRLQCTLLQEPVIRGLMRMACGGPPPADLAEYGEALKKEKEDQALLVYLRAIARGELSPDTDIRLLHAIFTGAINELVLFRHNEQVDDGKLARLVDMLLRGVAPDLVT